MSTNSKRSITTADIVEQRQLLSDSMRIASTGEKPGSRTYLQLKHPVKQTSSGPGRSSQRSPLEYQAASSPTGGGQYLAVDGPARGKRRPVGVDRGSDSDLRRRDERVRFAPDTVVQTSDGRALIVDDSTAGGDRRPSQSRRSPSTSGTLPARLRGQAVRRTLPELDQKDSTDVERVVRKSVQRGQTRPTSAVSMSADDDDLRFGGSSSAAARTGSVPVSINVLHRGNSASTQAATRRAVDSNYYRDSASTKVRR